MAIAATYISTSQFSVEGDQTAVFRIGTRIRLDQGVDGVVISDVAAAVYVAGTDLTTITTESVALTSNLTAVERGHTFVDPVAEESNQAKHYHTADWDGGQIEGNTAAIDAFIWAQLAER